MKESWIGADESSGGSRFYCCPDDKRTHNYGDIVLFYHGAILEMLLPDLNNRPNFLRGLKLF